MKLSATQDNLNKALSTVNRIVSTRSSLPILSNVLLTTDSSRLKISATNLELGINYFIGAKVEEEGSMTVPARLFTELVASLGNDKVQLITEKENLKLKSTNVTSLLNGQSADDFPDVPKVKSKTKIKIDAKKLLKLLNQVIISASADESRPVLAGIYLAQQDKTLILAATDSYRLSEVKASGDVTIDSPIIIPLRTVNEVVRILAGYDGEIEVTISKTEVMFSIGDIELVSRLIDGKFPAYQQIIPKKFKTKMAIDREELIRAVKVSTLFAREGANSIKLELGKDKLTILSSASQVGENTSLVEARNSGEPGEITLNARYLSDVLNNIDKSTVVISINDKLDPCLIAPQDDKQEQTITHIIMPLRS